MSPEQKVEAIEIGSAMNRSGLPKQFIADTVSTAFYYEGVYDLMKLWADESDEGEKDQIIADIQEQIDDCQQQGIVMEAGVSCDQLEEITADINNFKNGLRKIVDDRGGITPLVELSGVPAPYWHRFFNSPSRPRRSVLYKIAKAFDLSQVEVSTQWSI